MKKIIYILIAITILTISPVLAYETSKQIKVDAVNSYQPMQFVSGNLNLNKKKSNPSDFESESKKVWDSYVDDMPVNEGYVSQSPIAKETVNAEIPVGNISDDTILEGSVLSQEKPKNQLSKRQKWDKVCTWVKGKPSNDAVLLGMWSKHVVTKDRNEKNDLMAMQYGGISAGYFKNSWYKDTYFFAAARTPWRKQFKNDLSIDFQYKAGVMNGYGSHAPLRVGPVEAFLMPAFGFNYKTSGFDIWFVPNPMAAVFAFNFRVGIPDKLTYESVHARRLEKHPPKPKLVEPPPVNQYEQIQKEETKTDEIHTPAVIPTL